jgi:hypothetical protein
MIATSSDLFFFITFCNPLLSAGLLVIPGLVELGAAAKGFAYWATIKQIFCDSVATLCDSMRTCALTNHFPCLGGLYV